MPDEAYYWLWGQNPALSYYDHPPLQAWLVGASSFIFGHSLFALRAPTLLSTGIIIWVVFWWNRRLVPSPDLRAGLVAVLVVFSVPTVNVMTSLVFPDHLLLALLVAASVPVARVLDAVEADGRVAKRDLYGAALLIGLAGLTKYNAALFGLGIAVMIVIVPRYRVLFRSPHLYFAALLTIAILTPVFLWNAMNGDASFRYNLVDRVTGTDSLPVFLGRVQSFITQTIWGFSPFLVAGIVGVWRRYDTAPLWFANWRNPALFTFVVPTLVWIVLAARTPVFAYWNIVAIAAFLPLAAVAMRTRAITALHLVYGMVAATLWIVNSVFVPLPALLGNPVDKTTALLYGWPKIAARVQTLQRATGADFLVTTDYRSGAILAYTTDNPGVDVIESRISQFTLWLADRNREGRNAIVLADKSFPVDSVLQAHFKRIQKLETIGITRYDLPITYYDIYLAEGFRQNP